MTIFIPKIRIQARPSQEMRLIRCCARTEVDSWMASRISELLCGRIDWIRLRRLAHQHRVLPLVYRTLYATCPELVPAYVMDILRYDYQMIAARNIFLKSELAKILELFETSGIPVLPIKGPLLAELAYEDVSMRHFDDLDILVREEDALQAIELLSSKGFLPKVAMPKRIWDTLLSCEGEYGLYSPCGRFSVDIHWQIIPRIFLAGMQPAGFWRRAYATRLEELSVASLSVEDLILLLSIHGMQHLWSRHLWICDIAQLIRKNGEMDWECLFQRAREIGAERFLIVSLFLVVANYQLRLPNEVWEWMEADRTAMAMTRRIVSLQRYGLPLGRTLLWIHVMHTLARRRPTDKIGYLLRQLLTPTLEDCVLIHFPPNLNFLYAFLRPIRLLREYGLKPLARRFSASK
jgi:hypothetical protein